MRTRRLTAQLAVTALAVATVLLGSGPPAGATTPESVDAGDTLATAQVVSGAETTLTGTVGVGTDAVDLYKINITEPAAFSATTYGSAIDDTMLMLFDAAGHLVEANDDWVWSTNWSNLPAGGLGNANAPTSAGWYYLAVTAYYADPMAEGAYMWSSTSPEWTDPETGETVDGPADASLVLDGWDADTTNHSGTYTVALNGVGTYTTQTLYAVGTGTAYGKGESRLYTVDLATGQATSVAPVMLGPTPLSALTGLDVGPDGLLYAVDNVNNRLITIDKTTGAATVVGPYGSASQFPDITFDAYGYLFGYDRNSGVMARVRPQDGTVIPFDNTPDAQYAAGAATGPGNTTYVHWVDGYGRSYVQQFSPQTGAAVGDAVQISSRVSNPADVAGDFVYTAYRPQTWDSTTGTGTTLKRYDPVSGVSSPIGNDPDVWLTGLAFDTGTWTTAGQNAELSLTQTADPSMQSQGNSSTLTLTVTNQGPDTAQVTVQDALGTQFAYESNDGEATHNPATNVVTWAVGALAPSQSATLHVVVTVGNELGMYATATMSSDVYSPGPLKATAAVTLVYLPYVTTHPASTTVAAGSNASFTVAWNANPAATVLWQQRTSSTGTWTDLVGSTNATLNLTAMAAMSGYQYRAALTNSLGTTYSNAATLTVTAAPQITALSATVAKGKITVTFTVTGAPTPTTTCRIGEKGAYTTCVSGQKFGAKGAKTVYLQATNASGTVTSSTAVGR